MTKLLRYFLIIHSTLAMGLSLADFTPDFMRPKTESVHALSQQPLAVKQDASSVSSSYCTHLKDDSNVFCDKTGSESQTANNRISGSDNITAATKMVDNSVGSDYANTYAHQEALQVFDKNNVLLQYNQNMAQKAMNNVSVPLETDGGGSFNISRQSIQWNMEY